jgi:hypothetical protein
MAWSRETWRRKRQGGRRRFIIRWTLLWTFTVLPLLIILLVLAGNINWTRALVAGFTLMPAGGLVMAAYLWWDMERRYPDLE